MEPKVRKVKYVAGSGTMLQNALSDGQFAFKAGIVYTVANYDDLMRLTEHGEFVEVFDKETALPAMPATVAEPQEVVIGEEMDDKKPKKKGASEIEGDNN